MAAARPAASTDNGHPPPPAPTELGPRADNERHIRRSSEQIQTRHSSPIQAATFSRSQEQIGSEKKRIYEEESKLSRQIHLLQEETSLLDEEAKRIDARQTRLLKDTRELCDDAGYALRGVEGRIRRIQEKRIDARQTQLLSDDAGCVLRDVEGRIRRVQEERTNGLQRLQENAREMTDALQQTGQMARRRREVLDQLARIGDSIDVHGSSQQRPNGGGIREDSGSSNSGDRPAEASSSRDR